MPGTTGKEVAAVAIASASSWRIPSPALTPDESLRGGSVFGGHYHFISPGAAEFNNDVLFPSSSENGKRVVCVTVGCPTSSAFALA